MSEEVFLRRPTHPGEILREDILPALSITQLQLANLLRLSRQQVHAILSARSPVTAVTAVKLGALFGNAPQFWMNLQSAYDLWQAREKVDVEVLMELGNLHQWYGESRGA